ncbi:unnamed protein product, partial [Amoebophrya sp. A25]|eukprot:GSA25T00003909001.1
MAELVYGIDIKYTWIVLINPVEKISEKMLFLDRRVGVEVYFVDGWTDMLHARLQQIVQTRHEHLLSMGYKYDRPDIEPMYPPVQTLGELAAQGVSTLPIKKPFPAYDVRQSDQVKFQTFSLEMPVEGGLGSILHKSPGIDSPEKSIVNLSDAFKIDFTDGAILEVNDACRALFRNGCLAIKKYDRIETLTLTVDADE